MIEVGGKSTAIETYGLAYLSTRILYLKGYVLFPAHDLRADE